MPFQENYQFFGKFFGRLTPFCTKISVLAPVIYRTKKCRFKKTFWSIVWNGKIADTEEQFFRLCDFAAQIFILSFAMVITQIIDQFRVF